ncbi:hypothetical protein [Bauldia litoralis]|uniref:hypothetical protein n=1 Tax=Bauldia litoralis TaxID=665467 RepID=UPI003267EAF7
MMKPTVWGLALAATCGVSTASADIIEGYPDTLVCRIGAERIVGYLHKVNDDGSAIYLTLAQAFATVTPDGVVHRDGANDCDGKTLEELRGNS